MSYTDQEIAAELLREIRLRERVYPRQIQTGKLDQQQADRQIQILRQAQLEYVRKFMPDLVPGEPRSPQWTEHTRELVLRLKADVDALRRQTEIDPHRLWRMEFSGGRLNLLCEVLEYAARNHP